MAQGNITKKDKVNIPDWIGTNLYLENDFVINDNKFYRANGDIAAGETTLTIGTAGATWTEMSPSIGGQFTLADSVLSTTNGIEADGVIQSNNRWFGKFRPSATTTELNGGDGVVMPFDFTIEGNGFSIDATTHAISLTGLADNIKLLDFSLNAQFENENPVEGSDAVDMSFMLYVSDDSWATFTMLNIHGIQLLAPRSVQFPEVYPRWTYVEHVPGRQYKVAVSPSRPVLLRGNNFRTPAFGPDDYRPRISLSILVIRQS